MEPLQGLLSQLVERRGANVATAGAGFVARGSLELLKQEGRISRVLWR